MKKILKEDLKYLLLIIVFGLILLLLLVKGNVFGSNVDWLAQHIALPDTFRNLFYDNKTLLPNLLFNLGGGQNIFNFSYYGLLSPVILPSYLLPFVSMKNYIIVSNIILYLSVGILMYYFLKSNNFSKVTSFYGGLFILCFSPLTFHFHHHIMFVSYLPFLILSLMGAQRFVNKKKSLFLMISIFLLIMTNYYYAVSSLLVILIYAIYKLIDNNKFNFKSFISLGFRLGTPVLLSGFFLLPTFYALKNTQKTVSISMEFMDLIFPKIKNVLYHSYSAGISAIFIIVLLLILTTKKRKKSDMFLALITLVITLLPIFSYVLNGFLYVRGKSLIPFSVLFVYILIYYFNTYKDNKIEYLKFGILTSLITLYMICYNEPIFILALCVDICLSLLIIFLYKKFNKNFILLFIMIPLIASSFVVNKKEEYVTNDNLNELYNTEVSNLIKCINDDRYYRVVNNNIPKNSANYIYGDKYLTTSIYSSNYNFLYNDFFNNKIGNNIVYRNNLINAGTNNIFFDTMMGVKYVVSKNNPGFMFKQITNNNEFNLYFNESAKPLVYFRKNAGSKKIYDELSYPFNVEYMLKNNITNDGTESYNSSIEEITIFPHEKYEFSTKNDEKYVFNLENKLENKVLLISFDMKYNYKKDVIIKINGVENKLTSKSWMYHNNNYSFEYVIADPIIDKLEIEVTKGKHVIDNIKTYIMDFDVAPEKSVDNLFIDFKKSEITGTLNNQNGYVITSFPYDAGYSVYIDDKKVDAQIVNEAFLGFKTSGGNKFVIKYSCPWLKLGSIVSIGGLILGFGIIYLEKKSKK